MNIRGFAVAAACLLAAIPAIAPAQGYQVQPMLTTITPSGPNSRVAMTIKNLGAVPITLEMIPFKATVDETGTPTRLDEERDILIYPAQASIDPGKEQTVQVRYIGDPALTEARMYGVRVSQLPISAAALAGGASSGVSSDVKMSFNFLSHIIVSPTGAKSEVTVADAGRAPNGDLMLRISNTGDGIAVLNASNFTLTDAAGKSVSIAPDDLKIGAFSAFMPRQVRRATVDAKDLQGLVAPIKTTLSLQ